MCLTFDTTQRIARRLHEKMYHHDCCRYTLMLMHKEQTTGGYASRRYNGL